ncbi:SRPBCC family protein [Aggregatimonas sangjinii]|uniref:SRPBCC family protein n=1 Tax=Aggregatimonas sangjinii TaxID=2583587 RepID=A0A5B7SR30_9FLAO|nr:SRPBCC family protein [Aggregatimonas sangjinii]QCW99427.1 SRPBCC family protein [Aggregatimonas sangjinii]
MDLYKTGILTLSFLLMMCSLNAQNTVKVKVENDIVLNADLDEVWTAISNLGNLDKLVPEIIGETEGIGNGKGAIVTLTLNANGAKVVEEITKLDNKKRVISYEMLETPMPLSYYKATISITQTDSPEFVIRFKAVFKTDKTNEEKMRTTIDNFQRTLLSNVKNKYYEK